MGERLHNTAVEAKALLPAMPPWMEEAYRPKADRVNCRDIGASVTIAPDTGIRQISALGEAAMLAASDCDRSDGRFQRRLRATRNIRSGRPRTARLRLASRR